MGQENVIQWILLRTLAAGPGFFVPRTRAAAGFTLRLKDGENPREDSYPTTIFTMAGCRVRHLVTNKGAGHGR
jgi:hypothetical protein